VIDAERRRRDDLPLEGWHSSFMVAPSRRSVSRELRAATCVWVLAIRSLPPDQRDHPSPCVSMAILPVRDVARLLGKRRRHRPVSQFRAFELCVVGSGPGAVKLARLSPREARGMSRLTRASSRSDRMTPSHGQAHWRRSSDTHAQHLSMSRSSAHPGSPRSMHSEFLAHAWARPEARVAAPRPRWLPGLRLGVLLLVATTRDIKLCAGLAAFGFGTLVTRSPRDPGDAVSPSWRRR
jgi:hypothetical protein